MIIYRPNWRTGLLISIFSIFLHILIVNGDVFTAMVELENLLISEAGTTSAIIDGYIQSEIQRLNRLREFAEDYAKKNQRTQREEFDVVTNPVNAYLLIKRLNADWKRIKRLMHSSEADTYIKNITQGRINNAVKYPDDDDLDGAAIGLLRLQDTYQLKTADLANGFIKGQQVGSGLTAQDCFEVGRAAYNGKDYYHTLQWMEEALERIKSERPPTVRESEILEYYAFALYHQGNPKRAFAMTLRLYELDPTHPRARGNIDWYEERLELSDRTHLDELPPVKNVRDKTYDILERDVYEQLCRGEYTQNESMDLRAYCYYKRDRPFLKLAPIKTEILRYEPLVVLFKGVISDDEIAVIKELATPRLRRATVQNAKTGELEFASYRISKSAWLKDHEHEVIHRVNQRIDMMTNLNQETSEDLQVANYGIGGHYDPHFDFARRGEANPYRGLTGNRIATVLFYKEEKNAFKKLGTGNRIATVLFYMSQPRLGGATVYTELGTGVSPTLHDALFWYNLKRSGEGDLRTRHAACPVLSGVKWVSNKWIHERGQEFRRPCGLTPDVEEQFIGDLKPE